MSATLQVYSVTSPRAEGTVWYQLHSEREAICEALIREPWPSNQFGAVVGDTPHVKQLRSRLRLVEDALDRLMAGSYGYCIKCRRLIEDERLDSDPAAVACDQCLESIEIQH